MQPENKSSDLFANDMGVDPMAKQYIKSMAGWAMVIVVTSVIGYVLNILDLFREKPRSSSVAEGFDIGLTEKFGASETFSSLLTICIGLLMNYFLFRFASQARVGVDGLDQSKLNAGFRNLKAYFMAFTIILIIAFVYVLLMGIVLGAQGVV